MDVSGPMSKILLGGLTTNRIRAKIVLTTWLLAWGVSVNAFEQCNPIPPECGDTYSMSDSICEQECTEIEEVKVEGYKGTCAGAFCFGLDMFDPLAYLAGFSNQSENNDAEQENPQGETGTGDGKTRTESSCHPVSFASGQKLEITNDYVDSKREMPLTVKRSLIGGYQRYGNQDQNILGVGWLTNLDNRLRIYTSDANTPRDYCYIPASGSTATNDNCDIISFTTTSKVTAYIEDKIATFDKVSQGGGVWYFSNLKHISNYPEAVISYDSTSEQWQLSMPNGMVYTYYKDGRLKTIKNIEGVTHTYTYDSGKKLSTVTHSSGRKLTLTWEGRHVKQVSLPDGQSISYEGEVYYDSGREKFLLKDVSYSNSPGSIQYEYSSGSLVGVYLDDIKYKEMTYYGSGRVHTSGLVDGVEQSEFVYDSTAHTTTVKNAKGAETVYAYETNGNLESINRKTNQNATCPDSTAYYDYLGSKRTKYVNYKKDWSGRITSYTYYPNTSNNLVETEYSDGKTTLFEWDQYRRLLNKTVWEGALPQVDCVLNACTKSATTGDSFISRLEKRYSGPNNRLSSIAAVDAHGNRSTTSYSYVLYSNKLIQKKVVDGPRTDISDTTTYNYSSTGDLTSINNAEGLTTTFYYTGGRSEPYRIIDANSLRTDYSYDGKYRLLTETVYDSVSTRTSNYSYNRFGKISTVTAPGFNRTFEYDNAGRKLGWVDSSPNSAYDNIQQRIDYDLLSNVVSTKSIYGDTELEYYQYQTSYGATQTNVRPVVVGITDQLKRWQYDSQGNLEATLNDLGSVATSYTYDQSLNVKSVNNALGNTTDYTYEANSRLTSETNDANERTDYKYDLAGNLESIEDPKNNTTAYSQTNSRTKTTSSPDTGLTTFNYDSAGNLTKIVKNNNVEINYTYDKLNRPKTVRTSGTGTAYQAIDYYYDSYSGCSYGKGRLCRINDNSGSTTYSYTKAGNLAKQTSVIADKTFTITYAYDSYNRLSTETYSPSGIQIRYGYGVDSILNKVEAYVSGQWKTVVSVTPGPKYRHYQFGNGVTTDYEYDGDGGLIKIDSTKYTKEYSLNRDNLVTGERKAVIKGTYVNWHSYDYDEAGRLVGSYVSGSASTQDKYNEYWNYDDNGNRTSYTINGTTLSYGYDSASNRLTSRPRSSSPRYDSVGNPTYYQAAEPINLAYDYLGRVNRIDPSSPLDFNLKNNFQNHRVFKQRLTYGNETGKNYFIFNSVGTLLYEEKYASSETDQKKHYIYFGGEIVGYIFNNTLYYVHNDRMGRPELLTNSSGTTIWKVENSPFGRVRYLTSNSAIDFNIGFPGQYWDSNAGIWYNWHRYYDQDTGRYIQSDPIGLTGGMNTYAYVGGSPLSFVDPDGLSPVVFSQLFEWSFAASRTLGLTGPMINGLGARANTDWLLGAVRTGSGLGTVSFGALALGAGGSAAATTVAPVACAGIGAYEAAAGVDEVVADLTGQTIGDWVVEGMVQAGIVADPMAGSGYNYY